MNRPQKNLLSSIVKENSWLPAAYHDVQSQLGTSVSINNRQYQIESILGQGGFAFVFLVRSLDRRAFALKRMYVNNRQDLTVCLREIDLLKEFSSNGNIVKFIDVSVRCLSFGSFVNRQYKRTDTDIEEEEEKIHEILLLTDYCSNGPLINYFNEKHRLGAHLNEQEILRIFTDICRAVSACHFRRPQPVLHRDIKLENIIVDARQCYVLCDFGSAIFLSQSSSSADFQQCEIQRMTTAEIQQLEGDIQRYTTLAYRAPEMVDVYSRIPITLKADIWAMGCLLYKLMYDALPFGESILAIQNGTFCIPDNLSDRYSENLKRLLRFILENDVKKRPDIWQVSYVAFKLLGIECPIPNRCQSKIPDFHSIDLPLTSSQFREQRTLAASRIKSASSQIINESTPTGTAINPRERPRGIVSSSMSLMNFPSINQTNSTSSNVSRMFDDNFGKQMPEINSNNLPTAVHRRSASQTISSTFSNAPSTDASKVSNKDDGNLLSLSPETLSPPLEQSKTTKIHQRSLSGHDQTKTNEKSLIDLDSCHSQYAFPMATNLSQQSFSSPTVLNKNQGRPPLPFQRPFSNLSVNNTTVYSPNANYFYPRPQLSNVVSAGSVKTFSYSPDPNVSNYRMQIINQTPQNVQTMPSTNTDILEDFF